MPLSRREAASLLLKAKRAEETFEHFIKYMQPDWDIPRFQLKLIECLHLLEQGELFPEFWEAFKKRRYAAARKAKRPQRGDRAPVRNVLITMPPRHAKSTFGSIYFPAYYMGRDPRRIVMSCSYNAELATDFGRKVRDVVRSNEFHQVFPNCRMSDETRAADNWATESGGRYYGVGIGGTTSGRAANLLNIDDPIKAREDADSPTQRNKTWDYYASALSTRLEPSHDGTPPIRVITLTRWHPDDLAGRVQQLKEWADGEWLHINFPAVREVDTGVQVRNPELEGKNLSLYTTNKRWVYEKKEVPLWPERFPLEELNRKRELNEREFASLYQQSPYIKGGNLIKSTWWKHDDPPKEFESLIIGADTAFKKTETSDYSVAITAGLSYNGDIHIIDVMRGKYEFPELKRALIALNARWRGNGLRGVHVEDKASGQSLIQELRNESGIAVIPRKVVNDKVARVNAVTDLIEGGRVFLPKEAPWLDDFLQECVEFPDGAHDDQVDALSIVLDVLSRVPSTGNTFNVPLSLSNSLNKEFHNYGTSLTDMASAHKRAWKGWGQ
ncbi:MAG: phage terminase large subunit [Alphaproteobacteria bacterium]|nr:phage terminase large subunit [Alphaproteobacteria bacterium]